MYKVLDIIDRYPHVVLQLVDITNGNKRYWCFSELHAQDLCEEYHTQHLRGVLLDNIPSNGGWITRRDINEI